MEGIKKAFELKVFLASGLSALGYIFLQYFIESYNAFQVVTIYLLLFIPYYSFIHAKNLSFKQIVLFGILLRVTFIFGTPKLSDDFFRYCWDGTLLNQGVNPYNHKPSSELNFKYFSENDQHIYYSLNSKNYYTVYPPVLQIIFAFCAKIGIGIYGFALVLKILIILFEILTAFIIHKILVLLKKDEKNMAIYFLNPLIIIEFTGNLHGEVVMLLFLALALWAFYHKKIIFLGMFLALAFATKLYPILFLPVFLISIERKSAFTLLVSFFTTSALIILPFIGISQWQNMLSSLSLYFQNFEFNGGFYYLIRNIGFILTGYNQIAIIGKVLATISIIGFLLIYFVKFFKKEKFSVESALFSIVFIFYFFSTTVMPWYLAVLIFTSCFSNLKTGLLWSFLIILSYSALANSEFHENIYLVAIEYIIISLAIGFELFKVAKKTTDELY